MKGMMKIAGAAVLAVTFVAPAMAQTSNGDTTTNVAPNSMPGQASGTAGITSKGVGGGAPATTNRNVTGGTALGSGSAGANTSTGGGHAGNNGAGGTGTGASQ